MKAEYAAVVEHFYGAQQSLFLVFLCTLHDLFSIDCWLFWYS